MNRAAGPASHHPGLRLWRLLGRALTPALPLLLRRRLRRGKEDPQRWREKLGEASLRRPAGALVWVHAASVGEFNSALPLIRYLTTRGLAVLATTGTLTSARIAEVRLPEGAQHQFAPLDAPPVVSRFLDHWRPDAAIFVESELWPGQITTLSDRGIAPIIVNASLSAAAARAWMRAPAFARSVFSRLDMVLAQEEADAARFRELGAAPVTVTGNLKFDVPSLDADPAELERMRTLLGGRPVLLAASTHPGEETLVGEAHQSLARRHPGLVTIVVPRHPERGAGIAADLAALGLSVARRSAGESPAPETDIYLADTLSELGLFYRLAPVSFIGGSFFGLGGHNPIEAARLGSVVLVGPSTPDFETIYSGLEAVSGAYRIHDAATLATRAGDLLADPVRLEATRRAADEMVVRNVGALDRTLAAIAERLPPAASSGAGAAETAGGR